MHTTSAIGNDKIMTVRNARFYDNAGYYGAAITSGYRSGQRNLIIEDSFFCRNTARYDGGALRTVSAFTFSTTGSFFQDNIASAGAAIWIGNATYDNACADGWNSFSGACDGVFVGGVQDVCPCYREMLHAMQFQLWTMPVQTWTLMVYLI